MRDATARPHRRGRLHGAVLVGALMAVGLAASGLFATPAHAQPHGEGFVDLVITHEYGHSRVNQPTFEHVFFTVHNLGTAEARGVTVDFLLDKLEVDWGRSGGADIPQPSSVRDLQMGGGQQSFTWVVGNVSPGRSTASGMDFSTKRNSSISNPPPYVIGSIRAEVSSWTFESPELRKNNVRKAYAYANLNYGHWTFGPGPGLNLSVDNLAPTPSSPDVDFGLTVRSRNVGDVAFRQFSGAIADIEIRVELSRGLRFKDGWTPPDGFTKSSSQSATWSPGDLSFHTDHQVPPSARLPFGREIEIQTSLTSDSLADVPLEERCISAWVEDSFPPPDPYFVMGSLKQCLGDDPKVLFQSGEIDLFTVYPCAGSNTITYPCRDEDGVSGLDNGLELVATVETPYSQYLRTYGVGRSDTGASVILRPGSVVIQVKDPAGRVVNGGIVTWQTGGGDTNIGVSLNQDLDVVAAATGWSNAKDRVTATGADETTQKPGTLSIKYQYCDVNDPQYCHNENANADNADFGNPYPFSDQYGTYSAEVFYEMGALGTYLITRSYKGTKSSTEYTASARFIIHVGPVADLELQAAWDAPGVLTLTALNHGPDHPPAARVEVTLPPGLRSVRSEASRGTYSNGVWDIGTLETTEYLMAVGTAKGATLTLYTEPAANTGTPNEMITASIENGGLLRPHQDQRPQLRQRPGLRGVSPLRLHPALRRLL